MTEFKLCEEMGLKISPIDKILHTNIPFILASDVEKMLQGGVLNSDTRVLHLLTPVKLKPVTKEEILKTIKSSHEYQNTRGLEFEHLELRKLVERIEKAGIE